MRWPDEMRPSMSCRAGEHRGCSGCKGCTCHDRPPPADFRALVRRYMTLAAEKRGEAPSAARHDDEPPEELW